MYPFVQVFGCLHDEAIHTRQQQASENLHSTGHLNTVVELPMPRIKDAYLDCVLYLYPTKVDADDGTKTGGFHWKRLKRPWRGPARRRFGPLFKTATIGALPVLSDKRAH